MNADTTPIAADNPTSHPMATMDANISRIGGNRRGIGVHRRFHSLTHTVSH
jgi:hypothetical protein